MSSQLRPAAGNTPDLKRFLKAAAPLKPSQVFQTYWRFAAERQNILLRRLSGQAPPWTEDPVLQQYRFTNVYRVTDRVSQYLVSNVLYDAAWSNENLFFRCILFKLFNKIETWQMLREEFGEPRIENFTPTKWDSFLSDKMKNGIRLYSAAYIMPSGGKASESPARKHSFHLSLLDQMLMDGLPATIAAASTMQNVYEHLLSYKSIGPFLAFQYTIDLNYSTLTDFNENDFVVAGPGARSGILKCFHDTCGFSAEQVIHHVTERQEILTHALGIKFPKLFGRSLQPIDCQNLFCEVDKYSRVRHPESVGIGDRRRIKRLYSDPKPHDIFSFPTKWGISLDNSLSPL